MKKITVLVVCTGNSCRSQIAESYLNHLGGNQITAKSAGTHPELVNNYAIRVMEEIGIDMLLNRSNHVDEYAQESFDYVITVCDNAKENCPFIPATIENIHQPFLDPAKATGTESEQLIIYRQVRDEIEAYIKSFIKRILVHSEEE